MQMNNWLFELQIYHSAEKKEAEFKFGTSRGSTDLHK